MRTACAIIAFLLLVAPRIDAAAYHVGSDETCDSVSQGTDWRKAGGLVDVTGLVAERTPSVRTAPGCVYSCGLGLHTVCPNALSDAGIVYTAGYGVAWPVTASPCGVRWRDGCIGEMRLKAP